MMPSELYLHGLHTSMALTTKVWYSGTVQCKCCAVFFHVIPKKHLNRLNTTPLCCFAGKRELLNALVPRTRQCAIGCLSQMGFLSNSNSSGVVLPESSFPNWENNRANLKLCREVYLSQSQSKRKRNCKRRLLKVNLQ